MNASKTNQKAAVVCADQCRALVLLDFAELQAAGRCADETGEWSDDDFDLLLAIDAAHELAQALSPGDDLTNFEAGWYRALAVLVLVSMAYAPGDTTYFGRAMASLVRKMQTLPEMWQALVEGLI